MRGFRDRRDAGQQLGARLRHLRDEHPVVVGLPRGGVPVAFEVARALDAPLDVIVVRKLGVPVHPELGMGAVGEDGVRVLTDDVVRQAGVSPSAIAAVEARERLEVERRAQLYRRGRPMIPLAGRTVVVVDDGIATGGTARAALEVARAHGARRVVLAVPVAARESVQELAGVADEVVVLATPFPFYAVGEWYTRSPRPPTTRSSDCSKPTTTASYAYEHRPGEDPSSTRHDDEIAIDAGGVRLAGHLTVPGGATGVVVFAHGSGSSRHSPRNRLVAHELNASGLATLLFDLLSRPKRSTAPIRSTSNCRAAAPYRHALGAPGTGPRRARCRLLRCQHRCGRRLVRRGRRTERPGRRVPGWPPRSRRAPPG